MLFLDGPPLRLACDRCHKRKQRCTRTGMNDNKPCERCKEAGAHCVYSPPSRLGRPSNKSKREQQPNPNSDGTFAERRPSPTATSPTPPPTRHPAYPARPTRTAHSSPLSSSPTSIPPHLAIVDNRGKVKVRRSHSTTAAASTRFRPSPPATSSRFSDTASPPPYNFGSPPLLATDAARGYTPFQHMQMPRSQPRQLNEQPVSYATITPLPGHDHSSMVMVSEPHLWDSVSQDSTGNIMLGLDMQNNDASLLVEQQQQQQRQQQQSLHTLGIWPDAPAPHGVLQFQPGQRAPGMIGPDDNSFPQWRWDSQPSLDPSTDLEIPVTTTVESNQQTFYYW